MFCIFNFVLRAKPKGQEKNETVWDIAEGFSATIIYSSR